MCRSDHGRVRPIWPIPCYFEHMSAHFYPVIDRARLQQHFGVMLDEAMSWPDEINPQDPAPIVRQHPEHLTERQGLLGLFGLLPHWARDPTLARRTYNARSETAMDRPNFKEAWAKGQRCIVPIECILEPGQDAQGKNHRWQMSRQDGAPMGVAGLWSRGWSPSGVALMTFTLLTVDAPNHPLAIELQRPGEDPRMAAILPADQFDAWLNCPTSQMPGMLRALPADQLLVKPAPPPSARNAPTRISNIKGDILI